MPTVRTLAVLSLLHAAAQAQTIWIVDAAGGPGVHFLDLPTAVFAAVDGDTILVHTGPFGEGASPFTTNKGLTIVGVGGQVPIWSTAVSPFVVDGLPAGSSFRMAGFAWGLGTGELNFTLNNCAGKVHLERLSAREPGPFMPVWPAFQIHACADVTLDEIVNFGAPAVQIDSSRVVMVACQLGRTSIGLGGGQAVRANYSTLDIVEPQFDPLGSQPSGTIELLQCTTKLTGSISARVVNYGGFGPFAPVVLANGGTLSYDPTLPLLAIPSGSQFAGTAVRTMMSLPASFTSAALWGQMMTVSTHAPVGAWVFPAIGTPGFLTPSPLGLLGIDVTLPFFFLNGSVVPALGVATENLFIDTTVLRGSTFTTQSVVVTPTALEVGLPCTFVVH